MRIGIVGLGKMGAPIAAALLDRGQEVTVWNRSASAADALAGRGARVAASPAAAMAGDLVLTALFDDAAIEEVLLGADGLERMGEGCIHACLSTVSAAFATRLERFHADRGLRYLGVPMLGRPELIAQGGVNFLAGGEDALLDAAEPAFAGIGRFWRLGERPHQAQAAKLAANFMISGAIEAMAEAAATLAGLGADPARFFGVMTETMFAAPAYKIYAPMVAGQPPASPSGLALVTKDNGSFLAAAEAAGASVPLAHAVRANLRAGIEAGRGGEDWSTVLAAAARGELGRR